MTEVLLIDDDVELTSLMTEFFAEHEVRVRAAYDGPAGLAEANARDYDLILLDVMLPGFDGFEVLRRLRATNSVPVLMLTARTESSSRILGLETGADDYLAKPFEPLELLARLKAILRRTRGGDAKAPGRLKISSVELEPASRDVLLRQQPVELTSIEYDILETLMRSAGRVVSRDELMQRLYQRDLNPFERTLDVHISHLRKKLDGPVNLIRTVRGTGYQFVIVDEKGV